mmetsp:Transcript_30205/g.89902  ORF Transcript_30205/g.89902 Transcript_30205/m.89902 type:complete len:140 (+) Transcript_30205:769-1188(+)
MTNDKFYNTFKNNDSVMEKFGGSIGINTVLVDMELTKLGVTRSAAQPSETRTAEERSRNKFMGNAMFLGSEKTICRKLHEEADSKRTMGTDFYPKGPVETLRCLKSCNQDPRNAVKVVNSTEGVSFVNDGGKSGNKHAQ